MRDEELDRQQRVDAAKAAAPYIHPRLASVDTNVTGESKHTHSFDEQSVEQAVEKVRGLINAIGIGDTEEDA